MNRDFVTLDTFPKILRDNAKVFKGRPSVREKEHGIWQITTWDEFYNKALLLAEAFYASGLRRGDKIAIIGDNRPNLYLSIASAQILGAIPVPCYQDSVASEIQYILEHAEAKLAVVENQEQVDKLFEIKEKLPLLDQDFPPYLQLVILQKLGIKLQSSKKTIVLVDAQDKYTKMVLFSTLVPHGIGCQMFLKSFSLTLEKNQVIITSWIVLILATKYILEKMII